MRCRLHNLVEGNDNASLLDDVMFQPFNEHQAPLWVLIGRLHKLQTKLRDQGITNITAVYESDNESSWIELYGDISGATEKLHYVYPKSERQIQAEIRAKEMGTANPTNCPKTAVMLALEEAKGKFNLADWNDSDYTDNQCGVSRCIRGAIMQSPRLTAWQRFVRWIRRES